MRPRLETQKQVPHGVGLIGGVFGLIGMAILLISVLILLLGFLVFLKQGEIREIERPALLWILAIAFGVPGTLLGATSIVAGVGLRKMRRWGLGCSYLTLIVWMLIYLGVQGVRFSITTPIGVMFNLISLLMLVVEIYLTRAYYRYFRRRSSV